MKLGLFLGIWGWLLLLALTGQRWAQHGFAALSVLFAAYVVALLLEGSVK